MNSEKVKEIKKGLECCTNPVYCEKECPYHIYERHLECINELAKDSLTLINELECENERLNKSDTSKEESSIEYYNLYKDLKRKNKDLNELCELQRVSIAENFVKENQLKDRIALLEKDNETLRNAKVVYENVDYCAEDLKKAEKRIAKLEKGNEALSFAVKQGFNDCQAKTLKQFVERLKDDIEHHHGNYGDLSYSECEHIIDETLKECLCDKYQ